MALFSKFCVRPYIFEYAKLKAYRGEAWKCKKSLVGITKKGPEMGVEPVILVHTCRPTVAYEVKQLENRAQFSMELDENWNITSLDYVPHGRHWFPVKRSLFALRAKRVVQIK